MKFINYFEFRDGSGSVTQERHLTGNLDADKAFFEPIPLELVPPSFPPDVRGGIHAAVELASLIRAWLVSPAKLANVPNVEHWQFRMRRLADAAGREICLLLKPRRSPWLKAALENCGQPNRHLWPIDAKKRGMPSQFIPEMRVRYLAAYMLHSVLERSGYITEFQSISESLPRLSG